MTRIKRIEEALLKNARGDITEPSRRLFLKATAIAGVGFSLGGFAKPGPVAGAAGLASGAGEEHILGPFVRIATDNTVTVIVKNFDMGQGVTTGLPTIVAEELDAAWDQIRWEFAPSNNALYADPNTGMMGTGGSDTTYSSYEWMRKVGATARGMLVDAAAAEWGAPAAEITVSDGVVSHPSGKRATFGELALAAAAMTPRAEPTLKDPSEFKLIGSELPRIDSPEKTSGKAVYTIDLDIPGMVHAAIVHPPRVGGKAVTVDDAEALARPGVLEVVTVANGVAVVAESYYAAQSAANLLQIEWDLTGTETRGSEELFDLFRKTAEEPGLVARQIGDVDAAFEGAAKIVEATYEFPYLVHAAMEPLNAVVQLTDDHCEIWTGAQSPTLIQVTVGAATGLTMDKIKVNTYFSGGSFGRRVTLANDYVDDAVQIAKAMSGDRPVKLQWSRETDVKAGYYRPMGVIKMKGALDADGNVIGWAQRNVVPSIFIGSLAEEAYVHNGVDHSVVEGADINPYEVPNILLDLHYPKVDIPVSWWRSVGHTLNGYSMECFIDEMAAAGGKDAVELRRDLLASHPRHKAVLDKAVAEAGPAPRGAGKGRGVAMHESFRSYVAEVADITLNDDGSYSVDRVVCAIDCGVVINPDIVKAQMEGSIAMGLGAAMREKITITDGAVDQSNYYDYTPLRMGDMPEVEVHLIESTERPTGVGEPGLPPIGPAVANALRAAGAKPIRSLPFGERVDI